MPYGIVKSKKGKMATVVLERQDMCGECHACEMMSGKKACTLTCECEVPCEVGDSVEVTLTHNRFLKATYIMYGIPLIGFIMGLLLGDALGSLLNSKQEIGALLGAVIGIGLGFAFIKRKEKKQAYRDYFPKIIGKKN